MPAPYSFAQALIVEDDDQLRRAVERLLTGWNTPATSVRTVKDARAQLSDLNPDLIITDVRLPDGTGLMVAEAANQLSPAPLVIAMSGVASADEAFELAQHGVHIYLSKPFSPAQLSQKINEALRSSESGVRGGLYERVPMAANVHEFAQRYRLTPRQTTIVQLAVTGTPRRDYPEILGVTENTCKTMIRRLLHKCGARSLADIPRLMLVQGREEEL